MGANSKRKPIPVRGRLVRSATVGSLVFIETREGEVRRLYASHVDWTPPIDPLSVARVRELWGAGDLTMDELATMFGCTHSTIDRCVNGRDEFSHLPRIAKGSTVAGGSTPTVWPFSSSHVTAPRFAHLSR